MIGLAVAGIGVAFSTRPGLGSTPITSLPYVTTFYFSWTLGTATVVFNIFFILAQWVILKKRFKFLHAMQLPTLLFFGFFIDLGMWLTAFFVPENYCLQIAETALGCLMLAWGICFLLFANISYMPADGFIRTVSVEYHIPFGVLKIIFDCSMVAAAVIFSLIFLGNITGVREGTLVAAFLVGFLIKLSLRPLRRVKKLLLK